MTLFSVILLLTALSPQELLDAGIARGGRLSSATTGNPAVVTIDHVRVMFERKGSHVKVQQFFHLSARGEKIFSRNRGFRIELPKEALGARPMGEEQTGIEVTGGEIRIKTPIAKVGLDVIIHYELPIRDGSSVLDQQLGSKIPLAQAISTWTEGETDLYGSGFSPSDKRELSSGSQALMILGRDLVDGHLVITLSGLSDGLQASRSYTTFFLSLGILAIGLFFWLRQKMMTSGLFDRKETGKST